MRKFFYCILPFILIWGVCGSLLLIPQLHYEYLGTVKGNTVIRTVTEYQENNDHYFVYNYEFIYKDKFGKIRNSKHIRVNNVSEYVPLTGFNVRSENDWIVKQLIENGKVYAPGWRDNMLIITILFIITLSIYFFVQSIEHLSCLIGKYNYRCGNSCKCFGCPFCVTDQQTIDVLKINLKKSENGIKEFFGYSS